MDAPRSIEEYVEWAKAFFAMDFQDQAYVNLYGANLNNALNAISESEFFKALKPKLGDWQEDYKKEKGSELLMEHGEVILHKKPYSSAIDKSFRVNVLWNRKFPDPPKGGWITPENFFSKLHDVIRGLLVCKFLDGPEFLTARLTQYADALGLAPRSYSQERDEGYYALHFYATFKVDLLNKELHAQESDVELEIQTTTQLQEILKGLTYTYYKESRTKPASDRSRWKWEYETNRFKAGYLGHTLHLLEAMIVQLRDANSIGIVQADSITNESLTAGEPPLREFKTIAGQPDEASAMPFREGEKIEAVSVLGEAVGDVDMVTSNTESSETDKGISGVD